MYTTSSEITRGQFLLTPLLTHHFSCRLQVLSRPLANLRMCKNQKYISPVVQSSD